MFELTSYQFPTKQLPSSRAPFEPIEKRKMKFRWISSNSRGLNKSSYILFIYNFAPKSSFIAPNRRYFKGGLFICCVVHMKRASNQAGEQEVSWIVDSKGMFPLIVFSLLHGSSDHLVTFDTY